jgi:hypothetical protein
MFHTQRIALVAITDDLIPETLRPQRLVPLYLMSSFLYYYCDDAFYTDEEFDILAKRLLAHWGEINHPHKHLIDFKSLKKTSSAFYIKREFYPLIVEQAALQLLETLRGKTP